MTYGHTNTTQNNSYGPERSGCNLRSFENISLVDACRFSTFIWNFPQVNAKGLLWWSVHIGSAGEVGWWMSNYTHWFMWICLFSHALSLALFQSVLLDAVSKRGPQDSRLISEKETLNLSQENEFMNPFTQDFLTFNSIVLILLSLVSIQLWWWLWLNVAVGGCGRIWKRYNLFSIIFL